MKQNKQLFRYENVLIPIRKIVYLVLCFYDQYILKNYNKTFVVCYHSISSDDWRFSINPENFKKQINYLSKNYQFINADQLLNYLENKDNLSKPSILICFDDGYKDLLSIKNYLYQKNIKPLLFLISKTKGVNRKELKNRKQLLNKNDIKTLMDFGWTIGSHGLTHSNFFKLNKLQKESEIIISKKTLEKKFRVDIKYFSFPKGNYSIEDIEILRRAGYKLAFSMEDRILVQQINPYIIPRIGVDKTHNFNEFKSLFSPSVIKVRNVFKKFLSYV